MIFSRDKLSSKQIISTTLKNITLGKDLFE